MINLASQNHILVNLKSYPVTSINNNFKFTSSQMHQNTERGQVNQGVSPDPSFVTLDMHALAQNRWVSKWGMWNITWHFLEHLIY